MRRPAFGKERLLEEVPRDDTRIPARSKRHTAGEPGANSQDEGASLLAVQCGPGEAGHLVALLFSYRQALNRFREQNPELYRIYTAWNQCAAVWLRVAGHVPRNLELEPFSWVSQGVVPVAAMGARLLNLPPNVPLPVVEFAGIVWDKELSEAFKMDEIEECFGKPFLSAKRPEYVLNPVMMSEMLLRHFELTFDVTEESFQRYDGATKTYLPIPDEEIVRRVTERLIQIAHDFPDKLSFVQVTRSTVNNLVWLMKVRGGVQLPDQLEALNRFFAEAVERCKPSHLVQEDFYDGFVIYCEVRKLPLCSRAYFDRQATKRFGKTSHCLGGSGRLRGRVGWRLKDDVIRDPFSSQNSRRGRCAA